MTTIFERTGDLQQYLSDSCKIDEFDIQKEYVRLPADLAYWATEYANAFRRWKEAKFANEREQSAAFARAQMDLENEGVKKPTIPATEARMLTDKIWLKAKQNEIILESEKVRLGGILGAIEAKKDMLISLGATQREEMKRDPIIRDAAEQYGGRG
jgi:hypothetical protein